VWIFCNIKMLASQLVLSFLRERLQLLISSNVKKGKVVQSYLNKVSLCVFSCVSRGQNPLHILAQYAKDNAVAIFELFRQSMPDYPINALDADENIGELLF